MKKTLILLILVLIQFSFLLCTKINQTEEEQILNVYADNARALNREDLRGVMKHISEDFTSSIDGQKSFEELKDDRAKFILSNTAVNVAYREISIEFEDETAYVDVEISLITDSIDLIWTQRDKLVKENGDWKIVFWEIKGVQK